jgi:hypothetical protein
MDIVDWEGVSDSTWFMKSAGGRTRSRDILEQAKAKIPNANLIAIQGGTAETIAAAVAEMVTGLPMRPCQGLSARAQGDGVPHPDVEPTTTTTPRSMPVGEYGTFCTCAANHVLNICWMLNDVFCRQWGERYRGREP